MRRSRMVKNLVKDNLSKLAKLLESGESPIGLIGYIPIDEGPSSAYVKVKVVRLQVGESCIKVVVTPVSGDGELEISPTDWLDSPREIEDTRKRQGALASAIHDFKEIVVRPHYLANSRKRLDHYLNNEWKDQADEFEAHVRESYAKPYTQLNKTDFTECVRALVCKVHDVHENDRNDHRFRPSRY